MELWVEVALGHRLSHRGARFFLPGEPGVQDRLSRLCRPEAPLKYWDAGNDLLGSCMQSFIGRDHIPVSSLSGMIHRREARATKP